MIPVCKDCIQVCTCIAILYCILWYNTEGIIQYTISQLESLKTSKREIFPKFLKKYCMVPWLGFNKDYFKLWSLPRQSKPLFSLAGTQNEILRWNVSTPPSLSVDSTGDGHCQRSGWWLDIWISERTVLLVLQYASVLWLTTTRTCVGTILQFHIFPSIVTRNRPASICFIFSLTFLSWNRWGWHRNDVHLWGFTASAGTGWVGHLGRTLVKMSTNLKEI